MIVELGPTWWVKLMDFGLSKQCLDDQTALRTRSGTPHYMAPEVLEYILRGERGEHTPFSYTNAVDLWALGMTTYVLLLGELPFRDTSFQKLRDYSCGKLDFPAEAMRKKGISPEAHEFTKSLMSPRPEDRPNVACCFTHHWLERFSTPIDDMTDAFTQALIDRDTQASRTWNSDPSLANVALDQQGAEGLHGGLPSKLPFSSTSSQDSGIHMPFDTSHSTARKVPPQSTGQDSPRQASRREVQRISNQPLAPTSSQPSDVATSCERPQSTLHETPPRAMDWRMDKELKYHSGEIKALALSPDGTVLVSGGDDKVIRVWNTKDWTHTGILHEHTGTVTDLAYCPGGRWVVSASADKTIGLWDVGALKSVSMVTPPAVVQTVAISPDGALLATGDWDGDVSILAMPSESTFAQGGARTSTDKEKLYLRSAHCHREVLSVAFSPDVQLLASAGKDLSISSHFIKIWNPHTMSLVATLNHSSWWASEITAVAFSRDGKMLASGSSDSIRLWDVATGAEVKRCLNFENQIFSAHFTFDGRLAFGDGRRVVVWDAQAAGDCLARIDVRGLMWKSWVGVRKVLSRPDGTLVTAADSNKVSRPVKAVEQE